MSQSSHETSPDGWKISLRSGEVFAGAGVLEELGEMVRSLGASRALLVSDPGLQAAGHVALACDSLVDARVQFELFSGVEENPTEACVERGLEVAKRFEPQLLVALGGGSVMDAAKGVNFLYTNGGRMEDYWGFGKASSPMLPSVGVPCTAGTGSEAQSFALISRSSDHVKMACGDVKARFTKVLLDPRVLDTVPHEVAAVTGMDAISHALESFVTRTRNPVSSALAAAAWRHLEAAFPKMLEGVATVDVRSEMLAGAYLAGAAIEGSMLGLAHALANPLTARHDVTHGVAVGLVLPQVIRFNAAVCESNYRRLVGVSQSDDEGSNPSPSAAESLARRVEELRRIGGLAATLDEVGVPREALPTLAQEASKQWTATHNPRTASVEEIVALYEGAASLSEAIA